MEVDGTGSRMTVVKSLLFAVNPQIYCLKMFTTVILRNLVGHSVPPSTFKLMLSPCQYSAPSPHLPDLSWAEERILLMIRITENVKIRKLHHGNEVSRAERLLFKEMLQSFIKQFARGSKIDNFIENCAFMYYFVIKKNRKRVKL